MTANALTFEAPAAIRIATTIYARFLIVGFALVPAPSGRGAKIFDRPRMVLVDRAVRSGGCGGRYCCALAYWRPPGGASDNGRRRAGLLCRKRRGHAVAPHPLAAYGRIRHRRHVVRDLIGRLHPCFAVESHVVAGPHHLGWASSFSATALSRRFARRARSRPSLAKKN